MTDLELYSLIKDNATEYHKDGMFFVPPYNAQEFLHGLEIRDGEGGCGMSCSWRWVSCI